MRRVALEPRVVFILLVAAVLLLVAVLASKLGSRFGVPALLIFLGIGMLAGSDGPGGLYFDDPTIAMAVGSAALSLILFDGGLQTDVRRLDQTVFRRGALLATLGVVITALVVAAFAALVLGLTPAQGLLLGAILSSTDAAAVFSVLRARGIGLPNRLRWLIEFESGSNDPTAVFLTVSFIALVEGGLGQPALLPLAYVYRIGGGALLGWLAGRVLVAALNRIELEHDGLYPVFTLAAVGVTFGLGELAQTSGFMAVYVAGLVAAPRVFVHRRSLIRFHEGVAWLMQVAMFLILGLLVFPSQLAGQVGPALAISAALIVFARPAAVFACLWGSGFTVREKLMVSWVGLRGAAPIILATFPMVAGLAQADAIFNVVFVAVVVSVSLQGPTAGLAARLLGLAEENRKAGRVPIEIDAPDDPDLNIRRLQVEPGSEAEGSLLLEIGGAHRPLVVLIRRDGRLFIPTGSSRLQAGDELFVLGPDDSVEEMRGTLRG